MTRTTKDLAEAYGQACDALTEYGRRAMNVTGDLEDGINAEHVYAEALNSGLKAAEDAIKRVRDLHSHGRGTDTCNGCGEGWPCSTTEALDGQS